MTVDREAWNLVVRVGHDLRTHRKLAHAKPLGRERLIGLGGALGNEVCGLWVQGERTAQGLGCSLPGVVIGRGPNAAKAKNQVLRGKALPQHVRATRAVITQVDHPGE